MLRLKSGISARADQASSNDQNDPEQDLALDRAGRCRRHKYRGDHPKKGSFMVRFSFRCGWKYPEVDGPKRQRNWDLASPAALRSRRRA